MIDVLETKYLDILRKEIHIPALGTKEAETPVNTGVSPPTDSLPIVRMKYKKAKLCKSLTGWYAWFEYKNPLTDEWQSFTRKCGINRIQGINERKREGAALVDALNQILSEGWSPFGYQSQDDHLHNKSLIECLRYFLTLKKSLRPRSYEAYKDSVRVFEEWLTAANMKYYFPSMFRPIHAIEFGDYMKLVKKYAGKTFNNHRRNMSMFFIEMVERELIPKNPINKIKMLPSNTQKNLAYSMQERELLKEHFEETNPLLGQFCSCIYYLGIRPNELLQVQMRDVYIEERKIMIYTGAAKNRRQEPVYMSEGMIKMLTDKRVPDYTPTDFLFGYKLNPGPKPWVRNRVSELHLLAIKLLGLNSNHTLYSWKHTGAVAFYMNNGKDIFKLMKHLRHSDIQSTMKYVRSLGLEYNASIQVPNF